MATSRILLCHTAASRPTAIVTTPASATHSNTTTTSPAATPALMDMALQSLSALQFDLRAVEDAHARETFAAHERLADMELLLTSAEERCDGLRARYRRLTAQLEDERDRRGEALVRGEALAWRVERLQQENERLRRENEGLREAKRKREEREEMEREGDDDEVVIVMERPVKHARRTSVGVEGAEGAGGRGTPLVD